jgi:phytoene/squalene synthetase
MTAATVEHELERRWRAATAEQRRRGRRWYALAREWAEQLAERTGYTVEQVVAVLAITSAGAQLATNLRWTEQACETRGAARVGRFPNAMRPRILAVLASPEAAAEFVGGPKIGPFHRAILGDRDALVLDRWAIAAAMPGVDRDTAHRELSKGRRDAIEQAYRSLAKRLRIKTADLQAVIWLQIRETTEVMHLGTTPMVRQLADITH